MQRLSRGARAIRWLKTRDLLSHDEYDIQVVERTSRPVCFTSSTGAREQATLDHMRRAYENQERVALWLLACEIEAYKKPFYMHPTRVTYLKRRSRAEYLWPRLEAAGIAIS
jgi:hypothetical protein